jgi:hypothetical protein
MALSARMLELYAWPIRQVQFEEPFDLYPLAATGLVLKQNISYKKDYTQTDITLAVITSRADLGWYVTRAVSAIPYDVKNWHDFVDRIPGLSIRAAINDYCARVAFPLGIDLDIPAENEYFVIRPVTADAIWAEEKRFSGVKERMKALLALAPERMTELVLESCDGDTKNAASTLEDHRRNYRRPNKFAKPRVR